MFFWIRSISVFYFLNRLYSESSTISLLRRVLILLEYCCSNTFFSFCLNKSKDGRWWQSGMFNMVWKNSSHISKWGSLKRQSITMEKMQLWTHAQSVPASISHRCGHVKRSALAHLCLSKPRTITNRKN